ncbi:hypothetical protein HT031_005964 [Scenedesmus sp. PABB004]|nr:hypothetical protein HT031_005964 [Scenedesmus sp. PABB004]
MDAQGWLGLGLHGGGDDAEGAVDIPPAGVALAGALIFVQIALSARLGLGLHSQLAIGGVRCVAQLSLLGLILKPIFTSNSAALVAAYAGFMIMVSAAEALGRPPVTYRFMFLHTLLIIAAVAASSIAYALLVILRVTPWWAPQYLIPLLGMLLGNTISGISVGLTAVLDELAGGAERVERLLALGATRREASADLLRRALRLAMTPLLNQMSVVGLVSIPGMMTGQILGGGRPDTAARYQMMVMFLLGSASTAGAVASTHAALFAVIDAQHRLHPERLHRRPHGAAGGVNGLVNAAAMAVWRAVAGACSRTAACCCCCLRRAEPPAQCAPDGAGREATGSGAGALEEAKQPLLGGPGGRDGSDA